MDSRPLAYESFTLTKAPGVGNPSDVPTKPVDRATLEKHFPRMGIEFLDGWAESALKSSDGSTT